MVNIISYQSHHAAVFKQLNLAWLDQYHLTESHDLMVLNDPKGTILDKGGVILLAVENEEIVGTVALMKEHGNEYELAKMTVAPHMQGRGISKLLMQAIIEAAQTKGAEKLILFSNHQLVAALSLYEKFGFKHVAVTDSPFVTADVRMELDF
ncbi:MAG: GNAT family N-acetyltransferase [Bacteroidota bacterium]